MEGRKLTDIINEEHENVKYLPGVELPHNLRLVIRLVEIWLKRVYRCKSASEF